MSKTCLYNLEFEFTGIKGKLIQKWLKKIFLRERHLYRRVYNETISKINKEWDAYFPDMDLSNTEWHDRYLKFIQAKMQTKFDEVNRNKKGRILDWYVDDEYGDIYAKLKHLPFTRIEVEFVKVTEESE